MTLAIAAKVSITLAERALPMAYPTADAEADLWIFRTTASGSPGEVKGSAA